MPRRRVRVGRLALPGSFFRSLSVRVSGSASLTMPTSSANCAISTPSIVRLNRAATRSLPGPCRAWRASVDALAMLPGAGRGGDAGDRGGPIRRELATAVRDVARSVPRRLGRHSGRRHRARGQHLGAGAGGQARHRCRHRRHRGARRRRQRHSPPSGTSRSATLACLNGGRSARRTVRSGRTRTSPSTAASRPQPSGCP